MGRNGFAAKASFSGSLASALSAFMLAACGRLELQDPWAPLNGPSQWLFGTRAAKKSGLSLRHTLTGYAIHHAASVFWALIFERWRLRSRSLVLPAAGTAALACFVDYRLTPRRLTPGFERRLSRKSLATVYIAFAVGLAVAAALREKAR